MMNSLLRAARKRPRLRPRRRVPPDSCGQPSRRFGFRYRVRHEGNVRGAWTGSAVLLEHGTQTRPSLICRYRELVKSPCPFCLNGDGESSAEHWLPDSWEKYFDVPVVMLDTTSTDGSFMPRRVNNRSPFDMKWDGVCKSCNGSWLKDIDEEASHYLIPFATGQRDDLTAQSVLPVARHLTRAALIYTWGHRKQNGYPRELFSDLYRSRRVPLGVRVFVGSVAEPALVGGRHSALTFDGEPFAHLVSWTMGRLFSLVVLPETGYAPLANRIAAAVVRRSHRKAQLISPLPRGVDLGFRGRALTYEEARLLGQKDGLAFGEPEQPYPQPPEHYLQRLAPLNGDYTSLVKPASARWAPR